MEDPKTPSLPDLLQVPEGQKFYKRRRRHSRRFRWVRRTVRRVRKLNWRVILVVMLGSAAVVVMSALVLTINARNNLDASWSSLSRVWSDLNDTPGTELTLTDFNRLQVSVTDLTGSLANARRQMSFLRPFTFASANLETSFAALDAAQELAFAANDMLTGMQPVLFFLTEGEEDEAVVAQISSGERVVELLRLGRGRFLSAQRHLDLATAQIEQLDLANVSADLVVTVDGLTKYQAQLQDINDMLLESPDLLTEVLGLGDVQTYLILSQNSDEIRPSGGYISTYGWMTVRNGRIVDYNYSPTTSTSPNPPPVAMASEIEVPRWWIRYRQPIYAAWDSSWYADFPSTAQMAAWFYDNGSNPHSPVNGVIGIDLIGVEYLVEALGEVPVTEYGEVVTVENFREVVYRIRAEGEGDVPHKRFLAALYQQVLIEWQSLDQDQSVALRGAILRALQEKHVMLYFKNENLNRALDILGWLGAQDTAADQDYLMVADANLGNKSNRSVVRQLTYDVEIQPDGALNSRIAVSYDYPARLADADPAVRPAHYANIDYNNILQVFVPANSTLTDVNNLFEEPDVVPGETHTIFVSLVHVAYNQSERFQYSYTTPVLVEAFGPYRRYRLELQKQPGMLTELVNVQVTLPDGAQAVDISPSPDASYYLEKPILEFRVDLKTDQTIEIIYTQP